MTTKPHLKRVLVVLSPDLITPDKPKQSPLIRRAVSLAETTGCELELFHVCYDGSLENQLFESRTDLARQREALIDGDATLLSEMAMRLERDGIKVRHEVRWDTPRTDAILRKIAQVKPDVVMKQAREHSFVLGISSNTDWDLTRRSPAHVWLVNSEIEEIDQVLAAIGENTGEPGQITTSADYELLKIARGIGDTFGAEIYPVNAYQFPPSQGFFGGVEGTVAPTTTADESDRLRMEIFKRHSGSIKALAQYFNIDTDNVHICEGRANKVIPEIADTLDADMIVMGASSINRIERFLNSVTVEPVMADTVADLFIVREGDSASIPNTTESPLRGVPKFDMEAAITRPEETFASPQDVANLDEISIGLRSRILQAWEYDIRADLTDENEGGPARDIDVGALDEIFSAKAVLNMKREKPDSGRISLNGAGG
jgi:universal stress protein E